MTAVCMCVCVCEAEGVCVVARTHGALMDRRAYVFLSVKKETWKMKTNECENAGYPA